MLARAALLVLALSTVASSAAAQPQPWAPGWVRLAEPTVVRSAQRVHRIAIRDATPVDLLYVGVGGAGLSFESAEIRRADGSSQSIEISRSLGAGGREGVYLTLCGGPSRITRVDLRHVPGDARFDTRVSLVGRAREASASALALPCETHLDAVSATEPVPGYPWGAPPEAIRARCVADGGTVTESTEGLVWIRCTPFAPLGAVDARFSYALRGDRPGLHRIEVTRSVHTTFEALREALRAEVAAHAARLGRPRIDPWPVFCDVVFADAPALCATQSTSFRARYEWGGTWAVALAILADYPPERRAHVLVLDYRRP